MPDLPTPANQLMRGLREMAFNARQGATKQGESTVIDRYALRNALQRYLPTKAIDVFEDYCQNANGLLLGIGSAICRTVRQTKTRCRASPFRTRRLKNFNLTAHRHIATPAKRISHAERRQ